MARPTKLTPETTSKIVEAISIGATYKLACDYANIAYNTFNEWMKAGEQEETGKKREFYDAVTRAEGAAAVRLLAKIEAAAKEDWRAAAWKLERRYPQSFGRTIQESRVEMHLTIEDKIVAGIRANEVTYEQVLYAVDNDTTLAEQLFARAGVPVNK